MSIKREKKTTHEEIGETVIKTLIYIYIYIHKKWVQDLLSQCKNNVSKNKRNKKSLLHPS